MKFTILKVKGNSMHPTLESGAFVLVWHAKWLFNRNKLFKKGIISKFVAKRLPLPAGLQRASLSLKVGDVVAVHHQQYGLIIKRVVQISITLRTASKSVSDKEKSKYNFNFKEKEKKVNSSKSKVSRFKSDSRKQQQTLIQFRLRGDNVRESVTENEIGWVDANDLIGKVILNINDHRKK